MIKNLIGMHHVTAITSSAEKNYEFFTYTLGMRLVKKTVNQDDIQTYHLFFADDEGNAGTDMTFFDFPGIQKGKHGTNEIYRTSFRVPSDAALDYWVKRFDRLGVKHTGIEQQFDVKVLAFEDFDEQQYQLVSDETNTGRPSGKPWEKGPVPNEFAITGLGPVVIRISDIEYFSQVLVEAMEYKQIAQEGPLYLFEVGKGGNGARVIVEHNTSTTGYQGYGTVHHAAFCVRDKEELLQWQQRLETIGFRTSGYIDRFFFESLYVRVAQGVLFEFATEGPGFQGDEPYETLGEKLSLPPFLEQQREQIESLVRPINTVRSTKTIEKEYE